MIDSPRRFDAAEVIAVAGSVATENQHDVAAGVIRSPQPIILMNADRLRETVARTKEINCCGFSVIVSEDDGLGLILGREPMKGNGSLTGHVLPTEFLGEVLRQSSISLVFKFRWRVAQCFLISNIGLRRQYRQHYWRDNCASHNNDRGICDPCKLPALLSQTRRRRRPRQTTSGRRVRHSNSYP